MGVESVQVPEALSDSDTLEVSYHSLLSTLSALESMEGNTYKLLKPCNKCLHILKYST